MQHYGVESVTGKRHWSRKSNEIHLVVWWFIDDESYGDLMHLMSLVDECQPVIGDKVAL